MQENVNQMAISLGVALTGLLLSYLTVILKKAITKLQNKVEEKISDEKKANLLKAAFEQLNTLTENTVGAIEQEVAKDLRIAVKNGIKDRQELFNLSQQAFASICEQMKPEYLAALENNITNVEDYINDVIEANVLKVKSYDVITLEELTQQVKRTTEEEVEQWR